MPPDSTALAPLQRHSTLRVQQKKEWGEILTGFEGRNRYQVVGDDGQTACTSRARWAAALGLFLLRSSSRPAAPSPWS